ncbi:hypothetical protein NPIL_544171 [Nephila pilipes]|uniref:Uncharacterized protein n=1 Tax=Nephila pilipes TaxID=299642 RepID=A0A8X6PLF3_NEPPI|nr:hypothetical protein NPIL_544171 [Nephila pilipes]
MQIYFQDIDILVYECWVVVPSIITIFPIPEVLIRAMPAWKKPYIFRKTRLARLEFAKSHVNKDIEFCMYAICDDDKKFNNFGCNCKGFGNRKLRLV